jgi:pterin-4a-carbinolamine dehydratase
MAMPYSLAGRHAQRRFIAHNISRSSSCCAANCNDATDSNHNQLFIKPILRRLQFHRHNFFRDRTGKGMNRMSLHCSHRAITSSSISSSHRSQDPMAKRPNKVCDPYGQGGKPLSRIDATNQLLILDEGWVLEDDQSPAPAMADNKDEDEEIKHEDNYVLPPQSLSKEYYHSNYIDASKFASIVAAVAHNNNHYPSIILDRKLMKREKAWRVVTTVKCRTETLGGLSFNDFHVAMLIDVEAGREEVRRLLLSIEDSLKKHT